MPEFKIVVSDPETGKAWTVILKDEKAKALIGKRIGETIDGTLLQLPGHILQITGGSDKDGFPMHPAVEGPSRRRVLLSGPPCFHPRKKGERRRKTVHGNVISENIVQINVKIIKKPKRKKKTREKAEEKTKEKGVE
ncbi:30S ribosomal protein S6e [archaeon]|nr:MAG: 30S ribosomal protein S6e [archaeon]RLG66104.1 MAG: 30S ribosomal protein S6e [archaeon]HDM23918.1 30S ribosomal protein S6e [Candidatus Bathyarchaeota archaeon]